MQRSAGSADKLATRGHLLLRDHLIDQHRQFYPLLPFIVAGAVDCRGDAWATILAGQPGFLQSPDPYRLSIAAARDPNDPADGGLNDGDAVGLLGIELHTRRRNRLNGLVRREDATSFEVLVQQSFGNCPQYIQLRDFAFVRDPATSSRAAARELDRLDDRARAMIAGADTLFVASYVDDAVARQNGRRLPPRRPAGVRAHRRGRRAHHPGLFRQPLLQHPRQPDRQSEGRAAVRRFRDRRSAAAHRRCRGDPRTRRRSRRSQGAERLWRFAPRRILYRPDALPLRWRFQPDGWSPQSLRTGTWDHAGIKPGDRRARPRRRRMRSCAPA